MKNNILTLNLDYSKVSNEERKQFSAKVKSIHEDIVNKTGVGAEFTDWISLPDDYDKDEVEEIINKVESMKKYGVEKLIVIGIGGSYLGAKSAIDFIKGNINLC